MTTLWAMLDSAFYLAPLLNGWARVDDYIDGHGLVAMAPIGACTPQNENGRKPFEGTVNCLEVETPNKTSLN